VKTNVHTLLVSETGAILWTPPEWLCCGCRLPCPFERAERSGKLLRDLLSPRSQVQLILAGPSIASTVPRCPSSPQGTPGDPPGLATPLGDPDAHHSAAALDEDSRADGSHVLWVASQPERN